LCVIVRRSFRIDDDVSVISWRPRIVAPNVGLGDLMIWIISARRQFRVVTENLADGKNSGRRTAIAFLLVQTLLALSYDPASPSQTIFAEQNRHRRRNRSPRSAARALEQLHFAPH